MSEPCDLSAVEARRLIGNKKLSPVELLESCLARIAATNPALNTIVAMDVNRARQEAKSAEAVVMRGDDLGLLHGLPVAIKDLQATAGLRTTWGSLVYKDHVPEEDEQTVLYLRDTCVQAGVATREVHVEDIGWDAARNVFVDLNGAPIQRCFKLYPWEWLWHEEFGPKLTQDPVRFIEPAWKMLLSNKGLLPVLWELFPDHPNLLPAYESAGPLGARAGTGRIPLRRTRTA